MSSEEAESGRENDGQTSSSPESSDSQISDDGIRDDGDDIPPLREVDSDGSVYEPDEDEEDDEEEEGELEEAHLGPTAVSGRQSDGDIARPTSAVSTAGSSSDEGTPQRRVKRPSTAPDEGNRQFKRRRGVFVHEYLALLNADVEDAAAQYVPNNNLPRLHEKQVGMTVWTADEKELFFEALTRLGRDDAPGIARRVGTKGVTEVRQYLRLLQDELAARKQRGDEQLELEPAAFPAAVELDQTCCRALEEAADTVSLRQEHREEVAEQGRWGDRWLVTPGNCGDFESEAARSEQEQMPALGLFNVHNWLKLSEQLFMNASSPEGNWRHVAEEPPAIRATALEDFYSIAVSITRRIVAATLYISMSRIRTKRAVYPRTRDLVRSRDVEAAVQSLGLVSDRTAFWARCARRLQLEVFVDDPEKLVEGGERMSYEAVERALGLVPKADVKDFKREISSDSERVQSADSVHDSEEEQEQRSSGGGGPNNPDPDSDEESIEAEADEIIDYSALGYPHTGRARQALRERIRAERAREKRADTLDSMASFREEKGLWNLLGREPPETLVRIKEPDRPPRKKQEYRNFADLYPAGRDWRDKLRYVSEWETDEAATGEASRG